MRTLLLSLAALLGALGSPGSADDQPARQNLWPGEKPRSRAAITVHRPEKPNGAAAVICPGGGYGRLVTGAEGHGAAKWLNEHGITGVVLEYELPRGRSHVPLEDAQRALRTVRAKAKAWGLDPNRIGIVGFSAGGHLASTAGTHFDAGNPKADDPVERVSCRPDFMVLVYPVVTMGEKTHGGSRRNLLGPSPTPEAVHEFSNELQVTEETPPAYLAHAVNDTVVVPENSRMFHAALKKQGVATEYLELPSGGHGLNRYSGPMWEAWQAGAVAWLTSLEVIPVASNDWTIDSQEEWAAVAAEQSDVEVKDGLVAPTKKSGTFRSTTRRFDAKRKVTSIRIDQSPVWQNWNPVPNLGPVNLGDAPVFLRIGKGDYWMFGRYGGKRRGKNAPKFEAKPATLAGFEDVKLLTTPFENQFNAPGGLQKGLGGYHAWQSKDMVHWVHHGPVTEGFSKWVTSAEYADGKVFVYYDYPNDQDPHVYVDEDLTDGKPGKNMGLAVDDPSHGSDAGFIRDEEGRFHVILEDWSPVNASKRAWDSPLAAHAVSDDGVKDWTFLPPPVDARTKDTGKVATYKHPHWLQHPKWDTNVAEYNVHEPEQEAYGDWAAICVGGQYYLFGDYDPVGGHQMSVGWFTSSSLEKPFTWCDKIGNGHPDPDVGFAEGRFYLFTQQKADYTSLGPWVEKVEVRVGVDANGDGELDEWTDWTEAKETYDYHPTLSKHVTKTPATIDLSKLPAALGIGFELRLTDTTENKSKPLVDRVTVSFESS